MPFFENFEKKFLEISHVEKNGIFDKNFEFWLVFHTLTVCLKSCHNDYVRNFYVKCTPFAQQCIGKVQSVLRYPVGRLWMDPNVCDDSTKYVVY